MSEFIPQTGSVISKYLPYSEEKDREATFIGWNTVCKLPAHKLFKAGFIYTGNNDEVICFHCGLRLKNWSEHDDPCKKHAKHKPDCEFLKRSSRTSDEITAETGNSTWLTSQTTTCSTDSQSAQIIELQAKIHQMQTKMHSYQIIHEELQAKIDQMQTEIYSYQIIHEELQAKIDQMQTEIYELKQERDICRRHSIRRTAEYTSTTTAVESSTDIQADHPERLNVIRRLERALDEEKKKRQEAEQNFQILQQWIYNRHGERQDEETQTIMSSDVTEAL